MYLLCDLAFARPLIRMFERDLFNPNGIIDSVAWGCAVLSSVSLGLEAEHVNIANFSI